MYIPVSVLTFGNTIGGCVSVLDFGGLDERHRRSGLKGFVCIALILAIYFVGVHIFAFLGG